MSKLEPCPYCGCIPLKSYLTKNPHIRCDNKKCPVKPKTDPDLSIIDSINQWKEIVAKAEGK